jgi:hypothetical protein
MKEKKYKVHIIINGNIVFTANVIAFSEDQAREFAYEQFEMVSSARIDGVDFTR